MVTLLDPKDDHNLPMPQFSLMTQSWWWRPLVNWSFNRKAYKRFSGFNKARFENTWTTVDTVHNDRNRNCWRNVGREKLARMERQSRSNDLWYRGRSRVVIERNPGDERKKGDFYCSSFLEKLLHGKSIGFKGAAMVYDFGGKESLLYRCSFFLYQIRIQNLLQIYQIKVLIKRFPPFKISINIKCKDLNWDFLDRL